MKRRLLWPAIVALLVLSVPGMAAGQPGDTSPESKFQLFGLLAEDGFDPQNPTNEVVHVNTTDGQPVGVIRDLHGVPLATLDDQLEFKYYMEDRECGAGSPRIMLILDTNNSGKFEETEDTFLHGHIKPPYVCLPDEWVHEDLTDSLPRWEGGPFGNFPLDPWPAVEAALGATPVLFGFLIEDSQVFAPQNRGNAYYDSLAIGNRTLEDHSDTARNCSPGCTPPTEP
ncbi:MAG TPA: hypothetical protein VG602_09250 [Actinomycetota bacterium]|nr:hypothetical protein [Actinomycetota bacterium]